MYHIQWKFRDEIRPRFGIMRGREFYMKDAYSFDVSDEEAFYSYNKFFLSYLRTFKIGNKQQEHNLIDALKIACRKFSKERTGKKPFTIINLVRI